MLLYINSYTNTPQNVQLILKSYLPVVYGTPLSKHEYFLTFGFTEVKFETDVVHAP
jgi:hypothetical protein